MRRLHVQVPASDVELLPEHLAPSDVADTSCHFKLEWLPASGARFHTLVRVACVDGLSPAGDRGTVSSPGRRDHVRPYCLDGGRHELPGILE